MRRRAGIERELARRVLRWFKHVVRMDECVWLEGVDIGKKVQGWYR